MGVQHDEDDDEDFDDECEYIDEDDLFNEDDHNEFMLESFLRRESGFITLVSDLDELKAHQVVLATGWDRVLEVVGPEVGVERLEMFGHDRAAKTVAKEPCWSLWRKLPTPTDLGPYWDMVRNYRSWKR